MLTAQETLPADANSGDATGDAVLAVVETSMGDFILELNRSLAPKTVENFISYARKGHYDGTIFHRVIPGFMIQGGGFDETMAERGTDPPVPNESTNGLKNEKYTVAMARTSDPGSATSQFFVNTANNTFLNRESARDGFGYAVFGKVIEGTAVVDKIEAVATGMAPTAKGMPMKDVPRTPVVIKKVSITE